MILLRNIKHSLSKVENMYFNPNYCIFSLIVVSFFVTISGLTGCSSPEESPPKEDDTYLIKIDEHIITVTDYYQALEIAQISYSNLKLKPEVNKAVRVRLLNQIIEEAVLKIRAKTLGIVISEKELEQVTEEVKRDYLKKMFDKTLLENAINLAQWKEKLKTRLLMERVIAQELENKIDISKKDIKACYNIYYKNNERNTSSERESKEQILSKITKKLQKQRAEKLYPQWIKQLQSEYSVVINQKAWQKIIDS